MYACVNSPLELAINSKQCQEAGSEDVGIFDACRIDTIRHRNMGRWQNAHNHKGQTERVR